MLHLRKPRARWLALLLVTKLAAVTTAGGIATAATTIGPGAHWRATHVAGTSASSPTRDVHTGVAGGPASDAAAAAGGHRPWSLQACALAVGLVLGGIAGMPLNPLGGATAISIGVHLGAFAC